MTVYVLIACATAWPNYYDADNCQQAMDRGNKTLR